MLVSNRGLNNAIPTLTYHPFSRNHGMPAGENAGWIRVAARHKPSGYVLFDVIVKARGY